MTSLVKESSENFENLKLHPFDSKDVLLDDSNELDKNFYHNIQATDTQMEGQGGHGHPHILKLYFARLFSWKFAFVSFSQSMQNVSGPVTPRISSGALMTASILI